MIEIKNLDFVHLFHLYVKYILMFNDLTYNSIFIRIFIIQSSYYLKQYLITKREYFMRYGHNFSHISDKNFTFITNPNNMTYETYLTQPKSILEWRIIDKLARTSNPTKALDRAHSHPPNREFCQIDQVENQNVYNFNLRVN